MNKLSTNVLEQSLFSLDVCALIAYADSIGIATTFGEAERTAFQQAEYVRTGRSKTLKSLHLRRRAVDLHFYYKDTGIYLATAKEIEKLGIFWQSLSPKNRWGGYFSTLCDAPHFERNS